VSSVLVHYQELALKGRNRSWFINTLVKTIRYALADLGVLSARSTLGRIELTLDPSANREEIDARLARLPGIAIFSHATRVVPDVGVLSDAIVNAVAGRTASSFAIAARRADKRFPMPSPEIERVIGRHVQAATGWPVSLERPDLTIYIDVLTDDAFFYADKVRGPGGLPVGTSGRVLSLLSGGIDSPVAAWRMMRRGCRVDFVHFHSYPILSRASIDKARELVVQLTRHQLRSRLFLAPFGSVQQKVLLAVHPNLRVIVYRRLMLRIAERIAERLGAHALVTGDAVGQVASQTIENITVINRVATMPVLRPLIGFDKEEITAEAILRGTYEISIVPDEDCCTLFMPRSPATRASLEKVDAAEAQLDVSALVEEVLAGVAVEDFRFPVLRSAVVRN
jgi:thiamine biosynthesis protein ThiI